MNWKTLVIVISLLLGLFIQGVRLKQLESQVEILADGLQRQEIRVKQLKDSFEELKPAEQKESDVIVETIRKYSGFLDDHDVSGLLED